MVTAGDAKGAPCPASSASRPEQSPGRVLAGMKDFRGPIITKINNVNKRIQIYIYICDKGYYKSILTKNLEPDIVWKHPTRESRKSQEPRRVQGSST